MNVNRNIVIGHIFCCTRCGSRGIAVPRTKNRLREEGHLKKLYCVHCGRTVNHAECVPGSAYDEEQFFEEFESGNFDGAGNRKRPLGKWKRLRETEPACNPEDAPEMTEQDVEAWMELFGEGNDEGDRVNKTN